MSIQPLPPDVIAQIRSSTAITNLNTVISELVKNSLDAESTKIDISLDYAKGGCVVEDNGLGILPSEFRETGGLGKIYHSSRLNSQTPLHGGRGTFLASLSAMALLSITSHHRSYRSHNSISMHKSSVISRQIPAPAQRYLPYFEHGTRVTVRDLFGNMPVRVKLRAMSAEKHGNSKDWELLKREVVLLLLAWPTSVSVTIREVGMDQKAVVKAPQSTIGTVMDVWKVCNVLSQASFITAEERLSWVSVKASVSTMEVNGAISLIPYPTKHVQFLTFGIHPLVASDGQNTLHDEINRLFQNSAFGNEERVKELNGTEREKRSARYEGDAFTNMELKVKKGVDRWPMYYINIRDSISRDVDLDRILDDKGSSLGAIMDLLQALILEFLTKYHFRPKLQQGSCRRTAKQTTDEDLDVPPSKPSPSAHSSNRKSDKRKKAHDQLSNSDLLGANIKIPSFRQSVPSESPFDAWSRMKSGTTISNPQKPSYPRHHPATAVLPPTSSPVSTIRSSTPTLTNHAKHSRPTLISSSGKITRRPFIELKLVSKTGAQSSKSVDPAMDIASDGDGIVAWINPITKVRSHINQRTGLTLPATDHNGKAMPSPDPRLSCRKNLKPTPANDKPSPWIDYLLKRWDNPIFRPVKSSIFQVSLDNLELETNQVIHGHKHNCSQLDIDKAFKDVSAGINGRISKESLRNAELIAQVDKKFILVKLLCSNSPQDLRQDTLVIIDQHAADERIRIEELLTELCHPPSPNLPSASQILTTLLEKPIAFDISTRENELLDTNRQYFANWGILYSLPTSSETGNDGNTQRIRITHLPPVIAERCRTTPKLLIDLLRTAIHAPSLSSPPLSTLTRSSQARPWLSQVHNIPPSLLNMLNSRACRSAIMFNDILSREQCQELVERLADCAFPFQCAHGRVSGVPILGLGGNLMLGKQEEDQGGDEGFGKSMRLWKERRESEGI